VVATGCPACMLQITDMLSQAGMRGQVKHAVEVYAEAVKK
jgi:glycolate oxidase iron-sulfur subunit